MKNIYIVEYNDGWDHHRHIVKIFDSMDKAMRYIESDKAKSEYNEKHYSVEYLKIEIFELE